MIFLFFSQKMCHLYKRSQVDWECPTINLLSLTILQIFIWNSLIFFHTLKFFVCLQKAINEAATDWGLQCLRYEIRRSSPHLFGVIESVVPIVCIITIWIFCAGDISPPPGVKAAMEMQAEAERRKRAQVLESEGDFSSSSLWCPYN